MSQEEAEDNNTLTPLSRNKSVSFISVDQQQNENGNGKLNSQQSIDSIPVGTLKLKIQG